MAFSERLVDSNNQCVSRNESLSGYTREMIPIIQSDYAKDSLSNGRHDEVYDTYKRILELPIDQRKQAWLDLSPILADFTGKVGSFLALEYLYTNGEIVKSGKPEFNEVRNIEDEGMARSWFENFSNGQSIRERGTVTTILVAENIERMSKMKKDKINVVSIAAGSARCVVDALGMTSKDTQSDLLLIDLDPKALEYSHNYAKHKGLGDRIDLYQGNVLRMKTIMRVLNKKMDVAEAVGIMDYFNDGASNLFLKQVYEMLPEGGSMIASNVLDNPEKEFVHSAIGWPDMFYRDIDGFSKLFTSVGFKPENCKVHLLPSKVYCVIEARK